MCTFREIIIDSIDLEILMRKNVESGIHTVIQRPVAVKSKGRVWLEIQAWGACA